MPYHMITAAHCRSEMHLVTGKMEMDIKDETYGSYGSEDLDCGCLG